MKNINDLKLYNLSTGQLQDMPIDDVGPLIGKSLSSKLIRQIILQERMSKFFGFVLGNVFISNILSKTGLARKINSNVASTYKHYKYSNLNQAFTHRNDRQIFPKINKADEVFCNKILCSPADSYLNIRSIEDGKIELYPELKLDVQKMIGEKNSELFNNGGKFLLFTLKPFHDHTMDYPTYSQVINTPVNMNKNNKVVYSTDLNFAKFISSYSDKSVFDENHRVITKLLAKDYNEEYIYIEVGATNVNSIEQDNCDLQKSYNRGDQKSHFNFGSTIILLLPKSFDEKLYFPEIFLQDKNTSVAIKRRNAIAIPKTYSKIDSIYIANKTKLNIHRNSTGNIEKTEIERDK